MKHKLRVAYILHRFPYVTETFIMREMYWLWKQGAQVSIFSLLPGKHSIVHRQSRELLPYTSYSAFISWEVIKAQFHFLVRSPRRYVRALLRVIWQTYREPKMLLLVLALFPKSVYFAREMEKSGIDHVHAHFVWLEGIAAGIAADLIDMTFSIHPHAFGLFERNQRDVRCELENASQVITVSEYHRSYIAALCPRIEPQDIEIVHYGLDTDFFRPAAKQHERDSDPIRILSVGRLMEKKGYEYLIDACALLAEQGQDFQCQIVGSGPLSEALQTRIERYGLNKRVSLLGRLDQEQILNLYQTSDIFALACVPARSGDQDGMPNVLLEAMACELPVVTTPLSGIPDLVHDDDTGLLVKVKDVSTLAEALKKLSLDERLRYRLGKQARQMILKEFRIQDSAAKIAGIFRRIAGQHQQMRGNAAVVPMIELDR